MLKLLDKKSCVAKKSLGRKRSKESIGVQLFTVSSGAFCWKPRISKSFLSQLRI